MPKIKVENVEISGVWADDAHYMVQLWKNGPYWATINIGAEKPEDYGLI